MDFTHETAAAYLSAMIDGEGCVEFHQLPSGTWRRRVRISNTSPGIISAVRDACKILNIDYTIHERSGTNKPAWEFNFPGKSIPRLAQILSLGDVGKQERLTRAARYKAVRVRDARGRMVSSLITGVE